MLPGIPKRTAHRTRTRCNMLSQEDSARVQEIRHLDHGHSREQEDLT